MDNPLKQYFRRPSIHFRLPSEGKYYSPGVVQDTETSELPVYPMTAIDEITLRTPDALFNGSAIVDLIKSCVPSIVDPWKINAIDLDAVLIAIRTASDGNEMDIMSKCPSCGEEHQYGVDLVQLLARQKFVDYSEPLVIRDLAVKFRPLTYKEINQNNIAQFEMQKAIAMFGQIEDDEERLTKVREQMNKMSEFMNIVISKTIEWIQTPETKVSNSEFILEFLEGCDRQTNNAIRDYSIGLKQKSDLQPLFIHCQGCGHEYEQALVLNAVDFFA